MEYANLINRVKLKALADCVEDYRHLEDVSYKTRLGVALFGIHVLLNNINAGSFCQFKQNVLFILAETFSGSMWLSEHPELDIAEIKEIILSEQVSCCNKKLKIVKRSLCGLMYAVEDPKERILMNTLMMLASLPYFGSIGKSIDNPEAVKLYHVINSIVINKRVAFDDIVHLAAVLAKKIESKDRIYIVNESAASRNVESAFDRMMDLRNKLMPEFVNGASICVSIAIFALVLLHIPKLKANSYIDQAHEIFVLNICGR
jgi:hypothetical protein